MPFVNQLKEMGFDPVKAERAVKETGGKSLEEAMEWILKNNEQEQQQQQPQPQPGPSRPTPASVTAPTSG